ncbi:alpha/beta fold hydrolase (plasmid) [Paroceanicella profunda]|uniref:Alpha/beta fold hydrolase n=1 Tax=Paroceanicella profunda TaxID=2579971 RepID=A0A5B8FJA2_9RHOB|nr:alpha/beta fold hydrolase [Paroceanicella profunda]QDL94217.1 alpha/beta fold hydrolase [Paroceanicella profunda]
MNDAPAHALFAAGDVTLHSGIVFPDMKLSYRTHGRLNARRDNVILYPTSFGAQHSDVDWLIAPGGALNPETHFIVQVDLFGNGLSSSPSNTAHEFGPAGYPLVSYHDAVRVQQRLLTEELGIARLAMVYGWSMGGMQAYHWASLFPEMVERIAVVCGSARCSPFNTVFLESVRAALTTDPAFRDGRFTSHPAAGLRAMGRVYAGWAMSHAFYRDELWRADGFPSLEAYLAGSWDTAFAHRDANNLLAQLATWQAGDISRSPAFEGDFPRAMAAITAKVLLMPGRTDAYFQQDDSAREIPLLTGARSAELVPVPSDHGHRAGNPARNAADSAFLNATVSAFLQR